MTLLSLLLLSPLVAAEQCGADVADCAVVAELAASLASPAEVAPALADTDAIQSHLNERFEGVAGHDLKNTVYDNAEGVPKKKNGSTYREPMTGASELRSHKDGPILIRSMLQIDADGSEFSETIDPEHGNVNTSLKYWVDKTRSGGAQSVDTHDVPFFVMPYQLYKDLGVQLGDVAAVMYGDRIEYAIFADVGPWQKLGEGSIALHDNLGNNPWTKGGRPWNGIDGDASVTMVVFPGSREQVFPHPEGERRYNSRVYNAPDNETVRAVGERRLEQFLGQQVTLEPETMRHRPGDRSGTPTSAQRSVEPPSASATAVASASSASSSSSASAVRAQPVSTGKRGGFLKKLFKKRR